jgi:uncharacterized protein with ParB-like and HNH nuclease domain
MVKGNSVNHIDSDKIFIKEAFSRWYRVPNFQRPYVWETEQVNDLISDTSAALSAKPNSEYFLGSIVLQQKSIETDKGNPYIEYDILDGQQRLTTCLILHAVARDLTTDDRLISLCDAALHQEENAYDNIPERFRITFDVRDDVQEFVRTHLKTKGGTADEAGLKTALKSKDASIRNMANAILEIRRYFQSEEAPSLEEFFPFFRNKVLIIYVSSTELEDAFRLFTVLNDRGMRLRSSDILKTLNLSALKDQGGSDSDLERAARSWEEIEGNLGDEFDIFLSQLRTILVKEKARLNLLQEFEDNIYAPKNFNRETRKYDNKPPLLKPGRATFEFVNRYRGHYEAILGGNNFGEFRNWEFDNYITLLRNMAPADSWLPPLLGFIERFGMPHSDEFIKLLEGKFFGDWILRETPTARLENMNGILKAIEAASDGDQPKDIVDLLGKDGAFDYDKAKVRRELNGADIYARRFDKYVLYKLDLLLGGTENRLQPNNVISVEHVLPQNPKDDSQWCKDFSEEERDEWCGRLGNLVLIGRRKNTSQGRLDFKDKKSRYFEKNIQTFPNSLRVLQTDEWTPKTLIENHEAALDLLCGVEG